MKGAIYTAKNCCIGIKTLNHLELSRDILAHVICVCHTELRDSSKELGIADMRTKIRTGARLSTKKSV